MKTIFDTATREALIQRISTLNENSKAVWGKMNVYQMIKHCTIWEEMMQSNKNFKQVFIGKLFGRMALKKVLRDEKPLSHNTPTLPHLKITDNGDVETQKAAWIDRINNYSTFSNPNFVHVFFGKMTEEQVGQMVYKHIDHHLRQFYS